VQRLDIPDTYGSEHSIFAHSVGRRALFLHVITAPVVYFMILPVLFVDIAVTVYQIICFPVYGVKKVPRSDFIVIDRHYLSYLNATERLNCMYCSYVSGVAGYFREVAARTEEYWCPIKHARRMQSPHSKYHNFADYGDAEGYRKMAGKKKWHWRRFVAKKRFRSFPPND
jgi:hypothetical protein